MESSKRPAVLTMMLLISFASVSSVLFIPALPIIGETFQVSDNAAELTMTLFLAGTTIGQLPYGPLADRFGRKKTLYGGLLLAILSSLLCALSAPLKCFSLLLAGRFFMALGSSVGIKTTYTIIADVYEGTKATKVLALALLSFCFLPGLAILTGGFITEYISWVGTFIFLALYGALLFFMTTALPETAKKIKPNALEVNKIVRNFAKAAASKEMLVSSSLIGACTTISYIFSAESPFLGMDVIGLSPVQYGFYSLLPSMGAIIGGLLSIKAANSMKPSAVISTGITLVAVASATMLFTFLMGWINPISLFGSMLFISMGTSFFQPSCTNVGIEPAENKSYATSVLSFLNLGLSLVIVFFISNLIPDTLYLIPATYTSIALAMGILRLCIRKETLASK